MTDFKSFNFFIGANNAGKSTVLDFISKHLSYPSPAGHQRQPKNQLSNLERHGGPSTPVFAAVGFSVNQALDDINSKFSPLISERESQDALRALLAAIADENSMIWKGGEVPLTKLALQRNDATDLAPVLSHFSWQRLWMRLTKQTGGDLSVHWIPGTLHAIESALEIDLPQISLIPAIRQVGAKDENFEDFSGAGLISQLAALQNPEYDKRDDREKFDKINGLLQAVTGRSEAHIEIPFSRQHVLVHMDGRVLPLSSLGMGIHEVVMIASFCTLAENQVVCVEEPELHLHPLLQRKLISYLARETTNQYFIATHSAAFIDTPGAAIFHVSQIDSTTRITEALLRTDRYRICVDLGHRASDIVQANAIIWVEGPSDRVYLNFWIKALDPTLVESIHYSIMFYGGRLLSHLSATDDEVSEFIQLRSLNRNVAILMDSDKDSPHKPVNATKLRIKDEFELGGSLAWITQGREVENYVDFATLQSAVKVVVGDVYSSPLTGGMYDHTLYFERKAPKRRRTSSPSLDLVETNVDKVKVSRMVTANYPADFNILDLKQRVQTLIAFLHKANDA